MLDVSALRQFGTLARRFGTLIFGTETFRYFGIYNENAYKA